ncbi:MAG: hypothetical protein KAH98_01585, partial [Dehalococcoidia bacterium]|nr:hypothetical protein [Dehalococcoidia bacterium]
FISRRWGETFLPADVPSSTSYAISQVGWMDTEAYDEGFLLCIPIEIQLVPFSLLDMAGWSQG